MQARVEDERKLIADSLSRMVMYSKTMDAPNQAVVLGEVFFLKTALSLGESEEYSVADGWEAFRRKIKSQNFVYGVEALKSLARGMQVVEGRSPGFPMVMQIRENLRRLLAGSDIYGYLGLKKDGPEFTLGADVFTAGILNLAGCVAWVPSRESLHLGDRIQYRHNIGSPGKPQFTLRNVQEGATLWLQEG